MSPNGSEDLHRRAAQRLKCSVNNWTRFRGAGHSSVTSHIVADIKKAPRCDNHRGQFKLMMTYAQTLLSRRNRVENKRDSDKTEINSHRDQGLEDDLNSLAGFHCCLLIKCLKIG